MYGPDPASQPQRRPVRGEAAAKSTPRLAAAGGSQGSTGAEIVMAANEVFINASSTRVIVEAARSRLEAKWARGR